MRKGPATVAIKLSALLGAAILLSLLAALGCQDEEEAPPQRVAQVAGHDLTREDFISQAVFMGMGRDPAGLAPELRQAVLETLIRRRLVVDQAQAMGLVLRPDELKKAESELRQGFSDEELTRALVAQGLEYGQWKRIWSEELLLQKTIEVLFAARSRVSPEEIRDYYQTHLAEFDRPDQVLALHAILPDRKQADDLVARIQSGEDMVKAAQALGVSLPDGGEPTWLSRGHMPDDLENRIFALRPGKLAGPLASDYGQHVVMILDKRAAHRLTLAQAAAGIQKRLTAEKMHTLATTWQDKLRKEGKVSVNQHFLDTGFTSPTEG